MVTSCSFRAMATSASALFWMKSALIADFLISGSLSRAVDLDERVAGALRSHQPEVADGDAPQLGILLGLRQLDQPVALPPMNIAWMICFLTSTLVSF